MSSSSKVGSSQICFRLNSRSENVSNVRRMYPSENLAPDLYDGDNEVTGLPDECRVGPSYFPPGNVGSCQLLQIDRTINVTVWREQCLNRLAASAESVDAIVLELAEIVSQLGFEYCSYVLRIPLSVSKPVVIWSSTYPAHWLDHYFANKYLDIDPIIQRVTHDSSPLIWADTAVDSRPDFWEDARSHGIRHGWALATHGACMTTGMLSLARSSQAVTQAELADTEMKLVWLSHVVHGLIGSVELKKLMPGPATELTAREREVLRWSAAGKTVGEIGAILGISERTVTFHITGTLVKLNVVNKTQAVSKALILDLLS
ncbi:MAG TPA: LuxR family transcriptional regulator [Rhodanobacter sp.]|jgi:LuxR family quorum-sensing system transcriptional regulator SolR|nr:LuxR family transcriptional regulator [Rhodanobacter sp.]